MNSYMYLFDYDEGNIKSRYDLDKVNMSIYQTEGRYKYCISCQIPANSEHGYYQEKLDEWYNYIINNSENEINKVVEDIKTYQPIVEEYKIPTNFPITPDKYGYKPLILPGGLSEQLITSSINNITGVPLIMAA
jgi:hypothetical protein